MAPQAWRSLQNCRKFAGGVFLLLTAAGAAGQLAQTSHPPIEKAVVAGFTGTIPVRRVGSGHNASGVPLGGLGTGFLELRPTGTIHDAQFAALSTTEKCPPLRLSLTTADAAVTLIATEGLPPPVPSPRSYVGRYPIVDLDYGRVGETGLTAACRAIAPFAPSDAAQANIPAILLTVRLKNEANAARSVHLLLTWLAHTAKGPARPIGAGKGIVFSAGDRTYAIAGAGADWTLKTLGKSGLEAGVKIAAGAVTTLTFSIAWHVPEEKGRDGKVYRPNYTKRFADAGAVALELLSQSAATEACVTAWQQKVYAADGPDWLKDALINSLSLLPRNTVWLQDGLQTYEQRGKVVDSVASRIDGGLPLLLFFPELELQALRRISARQADTGEIPGRLGLEGSLGAPMFGPGRLVASAEFAILCHRAFAVTRDHASARELFPAVKRAMQFTMSFDSDSDGLIEEMKLPESVAALDRYRREWQWHGVASHTAVTVLAALRAAEELARVAKDAAFATWCREQGDTGRASLKENLWNGRYYRLYTDPDAFRQSDSSYLGVLTGQLAAWQSGLGDVADPAHSRLTLESLADRHFTAGKLSVPTAIGEDGLPDESGAPFSGATVPRDTWLYAAAALYSVARTEDRRLHARALELAERAWSAVAVAGTTWRQQSLYRGEESFPAGDPHFFGNLSIWSLYFALEGKPLSTFAGK